VGRGVEGKSRGWDGKVERDCAVLTVSFKKALALDPDDRKQEYTQLK